MLRETLQTAAVHMLRRMDPERAHQLTLEALKAGLGPKGMDEDDPVLAVQLLGKTLPNPIGLAAGFDKNADVPDAMLNMGFGFVEVGTVTPLAQEGNEKPRVFRLPDDRAVINRLGFNNRGLDYAHHRLKARRGRPGWVGANIGANKESPDRIGDYLTGLRRLYGLADYFTINISSPNTPGLRSLQSGDQYEELLTRVMELREELSPLPERTAAFFVKIAPDLSDSDKSAIADISIKKGVNGLIISNTTTGHRNALKSRCRDEAGGLSGVPLMAISTEVLAEFYRHTSGQLLLMGVGGISSGKDAYEKIRSGATVVQVYTALTFGGPGLIHTIKADLAERLKADGFSSVNEAVGTGVD